MTINFSALKSLQGIILLVIIAIFGMTILVALVNSQALANDRKRISDVVKIQAGLKVDFDVNGFYPGVTNGQPKGVETYLDFWPTAPKANGGCTAQENSYTYSDRSYGEDYSLTFCLAKNYQNLAAGIHTATSKGIQ
jgi:hypothetical protein